MLILLCTLFLGCPKKSEPNLVLKKLAKPTLSSTQKTEYKLKYYDKANKYFKSAVADLGGCIDSKESQLLNVLARKITQNSWEASFVANNCLVDSDNFIASTYPNGDFMYSTRLLKKVQIWAKEEVVTSKEYTYDEIYNGFLAAIIAHELAHYYHRHGYENMEYYAKKKSDIAEGTATEKSTINTKFLDLQEKESEADLMSYFLLRRSGFDRNWSVKLQKKLLSEFETEGSGNVYAQTHPTSSKRIANLSNDKFYAACADMEVVFSNIQFGYKLEESLPMLNNMIDKHPFSIPLQEAKAVLLHGWTAGLAGLGWLGWLG